MDPVKISHQYENVNEPERKAEDLRYASEDFNNAESDKTEVLVTKERECSDSHNQEHSIEEPRDEAHYAIPKSIKRKSLSSAGCEEIDDRQTKSAHESFQELCTENTAVEEKKTKTDVQNEDANKMLKKYRKCPNHANEDIVFYCMPCEEQICQRCLVPKHLKHEVNNLEDATILFRAKIQEKLQVASNQADSWKRDLVKLKDMQTSFQISLDKEYDKIDKCVKENADRICSEGTQLTNELDSASQRVTDAIEGDKTRLQNQIENLRSELALCSSTAKEPISNHQTIKKQNASLEELTKHCEEAKILRLQQNKKVYATINFEEQSTDNTTSIGKIIKTPQLNLIQEFKGVLLAASTARAPNGCFLVGDEEGCEVQVYRKQNELYNQSTTFAFSDPPLGVAVTTDMTDINQCLVSTKDSIMTFSLLGDWLPNFTSSLSKSSCIGTLCVNNGRLFGGHVRSPFITEFDISGDPLRTIYTQRTPRRFVLIDNTRMALCYHDVPGVDIINFEKQIANEVSVLHHMDISLPLSLCVDDRPDRCSCLFIGHCQRSPNRSELRSKRYIEGTGVIDQYCCITGQFVARLARGLCSPLCMTITTDGSLAVADGKTVKLYEVQHFD